MILFEIEKLDFILERHMIINGNHGTGGAYIAKCLVFKACQEDTKSFFISVTLMLRPKRMPR